MKGGDIPLLGKGNNIVDQSIGQGDDYGYWSWPYSLPKLSAFSNPVFIGNIIAMKAYLDSSGKSDFDRAQAVTLTAYLGTARHFSNFEADWLKALEAENAPSYANEQGLSSRYFHFNEAIHLRGGYSKKKGWDSKKTDDLFGALFNVFGRADRTASRLISCTVNLDGYREARRKKPSLPRAEQICMDICFSQLFSYADASGLRVSELFIDRGDWYTGKALSLHRIKKPSKRPWWAKRVASVSSVDSHLVYGVQAADYIAGIANRHYSKGHNDWWGAFLPGTILLGHDNIAYDGPELLEMTDDEGHYIKGKSKIRTAPVKVPVIVVTSDEDQK